MKKFTSLIFIIAYIITIPPETQGSSGGPPNNYAGNPPSNRTCIACHRTFGLNSGQGSLELVDLPDTYDIGEEYEFSLDLADPNARRWGFEITAINSENDRAGAFTVIDRTNTRISRPGGDSPEYMKQTSAGTRRGQARSSTWSLLWTAPDDDIGDVRFYFTGNAANNNGRSSGDRIYGSAFTMEAADLGRELTVAMGEYWNMISINVRVSDEFFADEDDEGPDVILMMEQLRIDDENHNVILLKNVNGNFYNPEFGFSNIPFWDVTAGYQVKLRDEAEAVWTGEPVPADEEISMRAGWNMIAYLPTYELNAAADEFYVLSPIIDNVIIAKNNEGHFMLPGLGFSNMEPWRETQGYMVKLEEEAAFSYPEEADGQVIFAGISDRLTKLKLPVQTGVNMSVLVENLSAYYGSSNTQVLAYSEQGIIVGAGAIADGRSGLAVWGDDPTTDVIDGLLDHEQFELYLSDMNSGSEFKLLPAAFLKGSELRYEQNGFLAIEVEKSAETVIDYSLVYAFPNPFNSSTSISYQLPVESYVSLALYNLSGQVVRNLFAGSQTAGVQKTTLEAANMPSGLYYVRLQAADRVSLKKVMLIR